MIRHASAARCLALVGGFGSVATVVSCLLAYPLDRIRCDADLARDPSNCGACGHGCAGGGCAGGACTAVALSESSTLVPGGIVADHGRVIWAETSSSSIRVWSPDAGTSDLVADQPRAAFLALAPANPGAPGGGVGANGDDLAWTHDVPARVAVCGLPACASQRALAAAPVGPIAAAGGWVFWGEQAGGAMNLRACAAALCADACDVATQTGTIGAIAVTDTFVVWTSADPTSSGIWRVDLPTPLTCLPTSSTLRGVSAPKRISGTPATALTTDGDAAYFLTPQGIGWIPADGSDGGGSVTPPLGDAGAPPGIGGALAVDDANVYWIAAGPVRRLPKRFGAGSVPVVVADDYTADGTVEDGVGIAVDDAGVYWTARASLDPLHTAAGVFRVAK